MTHIIDAENYTKTIVIQSEINLQSQTNPKLRLNLKWYLT